MLIDDMDETVTRGEDPMTHALRRMCVELQSFGLRAGDDVAGRCGGAGPAEGIVIVIGGRYLSVPLRSWYAHRSPYALEKHEGRMVLSLQGGQRIPVRLPEPPRFYARSTDRGIPLVKIALVHGRDCLASTVYQDCRYRGTLQQCTFCGIGESLRNESTVLLKSPAELACAARLSADLDGVTHVTLTAGCGPQACDMIEHYRDCIKAIKSAADIAVHVQLCPPESTGVYRLLHESGADTVGIHCESFDVMVLKHHAPSKAAEGLDSFRRHWEKAVDAFGPNQVSSFLIAGLGEKADTLFEGAECMASMGVFPYVLPLRPVPGTPLASAQPPPPEYMMGVYEQVAEILSHHALASVNSKAGCVRCGACSCLSLFEERNGTE